MASEFTITVTVREVEGGVEVRHQGRLGQCDTPASAIAHAISETVKRVIDKASQAAAETTPPSQTLH